MWWVVSSVMVFFRVFISLIVRKTVSIVTDFKARHKEDRKKGFVSQINLWHNSHLFWHNSTSFLAQLTSFLAQLPYRSEEHTSELQSRSQLICSLLIQQKKKTN